MSVLIVLTGWWSAGGVNEYVLNPLIGATDTVWNTVVGWIFVPFGAYSALKVSTCLSSDLHYAYYFYLASETNVMVKQDGDE